ncbi:hypothetical protein BX070DRAFT_226936 [Coemansia spiralis]|nr:hypothetical protein BX070DRAFT_226936 [Coemansia spiralis]
MVSHKRSHVENSAAHAQTKTRKIKIRNNPALAINSDDDDGDELSSADEGIVHTRASHVDSMYLDTVDRSSLDFDFEQVCSVSLSNNNVYACLVCGKYYQGRGKQTHAYFHSINDNHHVFINLQTLKVYILPDNYEVEDKSLNDIKAAISPKYTDLQVSNIDMRCEYSRDLSGKKYIVGFIGLNRIKSNDYMNVVIQAFSHIPPVRNAFLLMPNIEKQTVLVQRMAVLVRKMWHSKLLKAHVSPHELAQEVVNRSKQRFKLDIQGDAFEFLTWLLNTLHIDLGGTRKKSSSVIYKSFQGKIEVTSQKLEDTEARSKETDPFVIDVAKHVNVNKIPFLTLSLELPPKPLFNDEDSDEEDKASIPQVALVSLLQRYNGSTVVEWQGEAKQYCLLELPQYIICHVKRFSRNNFSVEKNPTVVNFPIRNVPFGELLPKGSLLPSYGSSSNTYDLIVNICHDGQAPPLAAIVTTDATSSQTATTSSAPYSAGETASTHSQYLVYLRHAADGKWYKVQDLLVESTMPQMILLSDSYIQIWQRNNST